MNSRQRDAKQFAREIRNRHFIGYLLLAIALMMLDEDKGLDDLLAHVKGMAS